MSLIPVTPDQPVDPNEPMNSVPEADADDFEGVPPPEVRRDPNVNPKKANSRRGKFGNAEACAAGIEQVIALLALGLMTPAQATAMRGLLSDLLRYHSGSARGQSNAKLADDQLDRLKRDPQLLNLFSSFLTDEQIESIMQGYR